MGNTENHQGSRRLHQLYLACEIGLGFLFLVSLQGLFLVTSAIYSLALSPAFGPPENVTGVGITYTLSFFEVLAVTYLVTDLLRVSIKIVRRVICNTVCLVLVLFPLLPLSWYRDPPNPAGFVYGFQVTEAWIPTVIGLCLFLLVYTDNRWALKQRLYLDIILVCLGVLMTIVYFPILDSLKGVGHLLESNTPVTLVPQISGYALTSSALIHFCEFRNEISRTRQSSLTCCS